MKRKRTPAERSIIYGGALGRSTLAEIDARLAAVGGRPLKPSSDYEIRRIYVPYFEADMTRLGAAIEHPPTRVQVRAALCR